MNVDLADQLDDMAKSKGNANRSQAIAAVVRSGSAMPTLSNPGNSNGGRKVWAHISMRAIL